MFPHWKNLALCQGKSNISQFSPLGMINIVWMGNNSCFLQWRNLTLHQWKCKNISSICVPSNRNVAKTLAASLNNSLKVCVGDSKKRGEKLHPVIIEVVASRVLVWRDPYHLHSEGIGNVLFSQVFVCSLSHNTSIHWSHVLSREGCKVPHYHAAVDYTLTGWESHRDPTEQVANSCQCQC